MACRPVLIHSVDRVKIAHKLSVLAQAEGRVLDILFEVNVSGEGSKFGFDPVALRAALPELLILPGLRYPRPDDHPPLRP